MSRLIRIAQNEIAVWTLGIATAVVGHGAAASVFEAIESDEAPSGLGGWLGGFVALTILFYALYENPLPQKLRRRLKWWIATVGFVPWLVGDAAVLALYGAAVLMHRGWAGILTPDFAVYVAALVIASVVFFLLRRNLMVVHTRYLQTEPVESAKAGEGPRHFIGILSSAAGFRANGFLPVLPPGLSFSDPPDLDADLRMLKEAKSVRPAGESAPPRLWPWEMLLRGLVPYRRSLCDVTLVCSRESLAEAPQFARILRRYRELDGVHVQVWAERRCIRDLYAADDEAVLAEVRGFDFGNLDELASAMTDLLKYLQLGRWVRAHDILIDFTGGTKPVSVVGAALTLRGEIRAQYVDTNTLEVIIYDLVSSADVKGA